MRNSIKKVLMICLAVAVMCSFSVIGVFADTTSPAAGWSVRTNDTTIKEVGAYKAVGSNKAALASVKTSVKTKTIFKTVTINGKKYTVAQINKNVFTNCKKLTVIKVKATKALTVKKGAFGNLNTKKITIKVTKKMSKKQFKKFKKNLKKAGFKGKIKRVKL